MAKVYNIHIVAEDAEGNEVKFVELVAYPKRPNDCHHGVPEHIREARGIKQVEQKCPHLRNVRAEWSRHISPSDPEDEATSVD